MAHVGSDEIYSIYIQKLPGVKQASKIGVSSGNLIYAMSLIQHDAIYAKKYVLDISIFWMADKLLHVG